MRLARLIAAAALVVLLAGGAWAQAAAAEKREAAVKPEVAQELKALRLQRLELMRERIDLALLREKGAPASEIEAAQGRVQALQERLRERAKALREKHPQAARRLGMARRAAAGGPRWGMRGWQGMCPRWAPRGPMGPGWAPGRGQYGPGRPWMGRPGMRVWQRPGIMGGPWCPMAPGPGATEAPKASEAPKP